MTRRGVVRQKPAPCSPDDPPATATIPVPPSATPRRSDEMSGVDGHGLAPRERTARARAIGREPAATRTAAPVQAVAPAMSIDLVLSGFGWPSISPPAQPAFVSATANASTSGLSFEAGSLELRGLNW